VKIFFANPSAQYLSHKEDIDSAIHRVLNSNQFILGDEVRLLEQKFAEYIGTSHSIGVANGTDAIELTLKGLQIGEGDEVITVSHTAVASVAAIENAGAIPVLVDIEPDYYTLDPKKINEVLTSKTKAILLVHIYGQPADLNAIGEICKKNNLLLIEDVSQAHGATFNGKRLGSFGDAACFSCYPTKNLGAMGDAGLITTNNAELARKIRLLREYGWEKRYESCVKGRNSRLDELQAAILSIKLVFLDEDNKKRNLIAAQYLKSLEPSIVKLPKVREFCSNVFHIFPVQSGSRSRLIEHLNRYEIYPGIHYPTPIHMQEAYKNRVKTSKDMSVTESLSNQVLSLPIYPELDSKSVSNVIDVINSFKN
jgi:dTDP-4-amino-4,6-dideoxygalactose transaminase